MNSQILIVGIGGQGVLYATKLLGEAAMTLDLPVIGSETHGMSQRGGSVASHLKIGDFDGPMIRRGSADVVIGFEPNELLRALPFLSPGGLCCGAVAAPGLPDSILTALAGMGAGTVLVDARSIALDLGNANLTNVVLIGAAAGKPGFPFGYQLLEETLSRVAPKKYRELNLAALKAGRQVKG